MRKLGKKQLTLNLAEPMADVPPELVRLGAGAASGRPRARLRVRRQCGADRRPLPAPADERPRHRLQGSPHAAKLARGYLRQPGQRAEGANELQPPRRLGDLPVRDGARDAHAAAEPGHAGDHHLALFHRLRRRDRLADDRGRRRALWRLHRARADHALAVHPEHLQRQLRHLLPQVHRHDLRDPLGAGLAARDRARLCRRRGDQVGRARPRHPRHRRLLRADPDPPSRLDDRPSCC